MDDLKVRITLGDTTLEGTLDELLESGTFKMEYDQAGLNKIVQEAVALQRAEYQKDPQHYHHGRATASSLHSIWDSTFPCMANLQWKACHDLAQ